MGVLGVGGEGRSSCSPVFVSCYCPCSSSSSSIEREWKPYIDSVYTRNNGCQHAFMSCHSFFSVVGFFLSFFRVSVVCRLRDRHQAAAY